MTDFTTPPVQPAPGPATPKPMMPAPPYTPESFSKFRNWCFVLIAVSVVLGSVCIVGIIGFMVAAAGNDDELAIAMLLVMGGSGVVYMAAFVGLMVAYLMLLYRAWNQIQDGYQSTSPGLAVGLLFVPCFNLYWIFIAHWKLTENMNSYIERHGLAIAPANTGIALTFCILYIGTSAPYIGILIMLVALVFMVIMINDIVRVSSEIADARRDGLTHAPINSTAPMYHDA